MHHTGRTYGLYTLCGGWTDPGGGPEGGIVELRGAFCEEYTGPGGQRSAGETVVGWTSV